MRSLRSLLSALLVCLSAGLCVMATQHKPLPATPQSTKTEHMLHMAAHEGMPQAATALVRPHGWDGVMQALAQGNPEASRILASTLPQTDAHTAKPLVQAMRVLLPRQPTTVLSATSPHAQAAGSTVNVCSPIGMSKAWRRQAELAVTTVHDIRLATRTQTCLQTLQSRAHTA